KAESDVRVHADSNGAERPHATSQDRPSRGSVTGATPLPRAASLPILTAGSACGFTRVAQLASPPSRHGIEAKCAPLPGRQILRALLERQRRDAFAVRREEAIRQCRPLLRHLTQHPADRLADEELALIQKARSDAREELEVAAFAFQLVVLREDR